MAQPIKLHAVTFLSLINCWFLWLNINSLSTKIGIREYRHYASTEHVFLCMGFLKLTFSAASLMNCLAASSQIAGTVRTHCMSVSLTPVARFSRVSSKWPLKNLMAAEKTSIATISFPSVDFTFTAFESGSFNKINYTNYFHELSVLILCIS